MTIKNYITINGSSNRNQLIECALCKKQFTWLKAFKIEDGLYRTVCRKCRLEDE